MGLYMQNFLGHTWIIKTTPILSASICIAPCLSTRSNKCNLISHTVWRFFLQLVSNLTSTNCYHQALCYVNLCTCMAMQNCPCPKLKPTNLDLICILFFDPRVYQICAGAQEMSRARVRVTSNIDYQALESPAQSCIYSNCHGYP